MELSTFLIDTLFSLRVIWLNPFALTWRIPMISISVVSFIINSIFERFGRTDFCTVTLITLNFIIFVLFGLILINSIQFLFIPILSGRVNPDIYRDGVRA